MCILWSDCFEASFLSSVAPDMIVQHTCSLQRIYGKKLNTLKKIKGRTFAPQCHRISVTNVCLIKFK